MTRATPAVVVSSRMFITADDAPRLPLQQRPIKGMRARAHESPGNGGAVDVIVDASCTTSAALEPCVGAVGAGGAGGSESFATPSTTEAPPRARRIASAAAPSVTQRRSGDASAEWRKAADAPG